MKFFASNHYGNSKQHVSSKEISYVLSNIPVDPSSLELAPTQPRNEKDEDNEMYTERTSVAP